MKYQITIKARTQEDFHSALGFLMFVDGVYIEKMSCSEKCTKRGNLYNKHYSGSVQVRLGHDWVNRDFLRCGALASLSRRVISYSVKEV